MRDTRFEQPILDFYTYPPIGGDDWRYTFQTAIVRTLEMQMLTRAALSDMANAQNFEHAADLLASGEYALHQKTRDFAEIENTLTLRRASLRQLFANFMIDKPIVELFKTRDDFANMRLAARRALTGKPLGSDYSNDGNMPPEQIELMFEEQDYPPARQFPDYMQQAIDQAVLAYYQDKDIRKVDYAIDSVQAKYNLRKARQLNSIFLLGLFRIQIDLTNIRTMFRLKYTDSEQRNVFLKGGFIEFDRLDRALELGYETAASLFFATPYHRIVETGAACLISDKSFLRLEQQCDQYLIGFLKSTIQIAAGPQPIIAYLLLKENEIRTVRLILTAKKNSLDTKLISSRIPEA
jgi:V/A-type H+-transporting ATPase subunit C